MGKLIKVKITSAGKHYLTGEVVVGSNIQLNRPLAKGKVSGLERWRKGNMSEEHFSQHKHKHWLTKFNVLDLLLLILLVTLVIISVTKLNLPSYATRLLFFLSV